MKNKFTRAELKRIAQETGRQAYPSNTEEDWTGDQYAAMVLASRLMEYWHTRGYRNVQTWLVRHDERKPGPNVKNRPVWGIRSNILEQVLLKDV